MPNRNVTKLLKDGGKYRRVSEFPIDRHDCVCRSLVEKALKASTHPKYMDCPRTKSEGMKSYKVVCNKCGETVAYVHATDKKLSDWCNLHSVCEARLVKKTVNERLKKEVEHEGETLFKYVDVPKEIEVAKWFGCLAVNISPLTQELGFECACGQDTRDFRASTGLNPAILKAKLAETSVGRDFEKEDSKFKLVRRKK